MWISTSKILAVLILNCVVTLGIEAVTYYASPELGEILYEGNKVRTNSLASAIKKASPGDTVVVLPGNYSKYLEIEKVGDPDKPILVKGIYPLTKITCAPSSEKESKHGIKISLSKGLIFSDFVFSECGNSAFVIRNSSFITLNNLQFKNISQTILLEGNVNHHILIQHSSLEMADCSKPATFIKVKEAASDLIFRNNLTQCVSNPIVFSDELTHSTTYSGEATNIQIHHNEFSNTKNSAITFTQCAHNVWIHHNNLHQTQNAFHFSAPYKGETYIFSNVGWNDQEKNQEEVNVFKFEDFLGSHAKKTKQEGLYIFNNTWFGVDKLFEGKGSLSQVSHWNNIVQFNDPEKGVFLKDLVLSKPARFDFDLSNQNFAQTRKSLNLEKNGVQANLVFKDPSKGNFALEEKSPAMDKGKTININGWQDTQVKGRQVDIGAYEGEERKRGPMFSAFEVEDNEYVRWIGVSSAKETVDLIFSQPMRYKIDPKVKPQKQECITHKNILRCPKSFYNESDLEKLRSLLADLEGINKSPVTLWGMDPTAFKPSAQ